MKLATLKRGGRDGTLVVVSRDLTRAMAVPDIAPTLQRALDDWPDARPRLESASARLNSEHVESAFELDTGELAAPLPRAYAWMDASAYVTHVELVRKARGAEMPERFWTDPLMYQGGSDAFLGPRDEILLGSEEWGIDFEAEVAVITDDVPMGIDPEQSGDHLQLLMLANDVSLRNLVPAELAKGFGFVHSKPSTAFSPVAVTPDELGGAWDGGKINLPLLSYVNDELFGQPNAGVDMTFEFPRLVAHAAATRALGAGCIVGSGTVSNRDPGLGSSCLAERRMRETLEFGEPRTAFLRFGDRIRVDMLNEDGESVFGTIEQTVSRYFGS